MNRRVAGEARSSPRAGVRVGFTRAAGRATIPPLMGLYRSSLRRADAARIVRRSRGAALAACAVAATAGIAAAQDARPTADELSMGLRPREDFDPAGVRAGGLVLEPSGSVGASYDSNVFATPNHKRSDAVITETVAITAKSDWQRNAIAVKAQGEFNDYALHSWEDNNNATVAANGRIDVATNAYFQGGGSYQLLHEDRGALVAVNGKQPTQFTVTSGNAGFAIEPAPMGLRIDATVDSYAYNNVVLPSHGMVNEAVRDRIVYSLTPRISYEITPQYNAFLRAVLNRREYNTPVGPDGIDRNSSGYAADAGIAFNFPALTAGEFYIGYLDQSYRHGVKPIQTVDAGANFLWSPTQTTSVKLNFSRSVEESALPGAAGFLQTAVRLAIEHEVMRDTLVLGSAAYIKAEFPGFSSTANIYEVSVGARYYLARGVTAGIEYVYRHRNSMSVLPGYTREIVGVRLRGEF